MKMSPEQVENMFTYHAPHGDQQERYTRIRDRAKSFVHLIVELCPDSREASLAITRIQEATQMANAAIAIHTPASAHPTQARGL